jgi:hypothetical protein
LIDVLHNSSIYFGYTIDNKIKIFRRFLSGCPLGTKGKPENLYLKSYTAVGLKTEILSDSTRERYFSFQTELGIYEQR